MDPSDGHDLKGDLRVENLHFIVGVAVVCRAGLWGNKQMGRDPPPVSLESEENEMNNPSVIQPLNE